MRLNHRSLWTGIALIAAISICGPGLAAGEMDSDIYAELLQKHVKGGLVDYAGFKTDEAQLDRYLDRLAGVDPSRLTRNQAFAYYINAYNAWTIKLILTEYPDLDSIKDIGGWFQSPWKIEFARINGQSVTLDHIEHDILRPRFKDPRVHFAINCASRSCPPLLDEPYRAAVLDQQLDRVTRAFINDSQMNYWQDGVLYVSRIFDWFGEDFDNDIVGFFKRYADPELKTRLTGSVEVEYLDYDWSLNRI